MTLSMCVCACDIFVFFLLLATLTLCCIVVVLSWGKPPIPTMSAAHAAPPSRGPHSAMPCRHTAPRFDNAPQGATTSAWQQQQRLPRTAATQLPQHHDQQPLPPARPLPGRSDHVEHIWRQELSSRCAYWPPKTATRVVEKLFPGYRESCSINRPINEDHAGHIPKVDDRLTTLIAGNINYDDKAEDVRDYVTMLLAAVIWKQQINMEKWLEGCGVDVEAKAKYVACPVASVCIREHQCHGQPLPVDQILPPHKGTAFIEMWTPYADILLQPTGPNGELYGKNFGAFRKGDGIWFLHGEEERDRKNFVDTVKNLPSLCRAGLRAMGTPQCLYSTPKLLRLDHSKRTKPQQEGPSSASDSVTAFPPYDTRFLPSQPPPLPYE